MTVLTRKGLGWALNERAEAVGGKGGCQLMQEFCHCLRFREASQSRSDTFCGCIITEETRGRDSNGVLEAIHVFVYGRFWRWTLNILIFKSLFIFIYKLISLIAKKNPIYL